MKILQLTAENVKKLRTVEITPDGALVQITGRNGSGKSSVLDSIYWALAGTKPIQSQPIRKGKAEKLATELEAESKSLTEAMEARTAEKVKAIAAAPMPIAGLAFGDRAILMSGLPFDQASSAEQLRASVAIAMAMNPKLRVLRIKDGSLLDEDGLRLLAEMATAGDYQIWVERVDSSGKVGIVMEDGQVAPELALDAAE